MLTHELREYNLGMFFSRVGGFTTSMFGIFGTISLILKLNTFFFNDFIGKIFYTPAKTADSELGKKLSKKFGEPQF